MNLIEIILNEKEKYHYCMPEGIIYSDDWKTKIMEFGKWNSLPVTLFNYNISSCLCSYMVKLKQHEEAKR